MRFGRHITTGKLPGTCNVQRALIQLFDFNTDFTQLCDQCRRMFGPAVFDFQLALGNRRRHDECSGFDAIGNDCVLGAAKSFDPFDLNCGRARAANACAHLVQQLSKIGDLRLPGRVVKRCPAARERCSHD